MYPKSTTQAQISKRDEDRHIFFLFKVKQMKLEIWDLIFKQIGVHHILSAE